MKTTLKKSIAALCLLASGLQAEIAITSNAFVRLGVADASKSTGMLAVEAGDYIAILAASNKGTTPTEQGMVIVPTNGATLGQLLFTSETRGTPATFIRYASVTASGGVDITINNPTAGYIEAGVYVVRATSGEAFEPISAAAFDSSGTATAITNAYAFSGAKNGVIIEAMSTYATSGATSTGSIALDAINPAATRMVGSTAFSGATAVVSSYALNGSNTKTSIVGLAFIGGATTNTPPPVASPDRTRLHPSGNYNVLFIAIDDLRPLINAYGETEPLRPITPSMDRLAEAGILFANAHCQQSVCNASRASLLTGLRSDTTRCWKLETFFRTMIPDVITLPQHFGNNGYRVHGIGKLYHSTTPTRQDVPLSWNEGWVDSDTDHTWYETAKAALEDQGTPNVSATDAGVVDRNGNPITDEAYGDGVAAALGVAKIAEYATSYQAAGTPFFLAVGFKKPHLPFNCPKAYWDLYDPTQIDLSTYTGIRKMPLGTNKFTAPFGTEPAAFLDIEGTSDNGMPTATEARHLIHGYLACVSYTDRQIGKLLDALEDPDGNPDTDDSIADNTIVVLWGDHGFHLGDHNGFWAKHANFEASTRVPLMVSTPALKTLGSAGRRCTALVELVDLYPTLLDLCSLPAPTQPAGLELQGTTFLPLLEDPAQPWKKAVFSQYHRTINANAPGDLPVEHPGNGMGYSIRTERYRYTEWWITESTDETDRHIIKAGITAPELRELYDYVIDPAETTNLATNVAYAPLIAELSALMNDSNGTSAGDGWKLAATRAPSAYATHLSDWKAGYLAPGRSPTELDGGNDPDGDRIPNELEYKFGTHPLEPDAAQVSSQQADQRLRLRYPDVEARTDVLLSSETTTNLAAAAWTTAGVALTNIGSRGNATLTEASVPTDAPQRFLRLNATLAP